MARKQKIVREGRHNRFKSRQALRMISVKVPGGRTVIQFKKKKPQIARCGSCNARLSGIPRLRPFEMMNLSKTKKRPERPFGGVLCSKCMRKKLIEEARK